MEMHQGKLVLYPKYDYTELMLHMLPRADYSDFMFQETLFFFFRWVVLEEIYIYLSAGMLQ